MSDESRWSRFRRGKRAEAEWSDEPDEAPGGFIDDDEAAAPAPPSQAPPQQALPQAPPGSRPPARPSPPPAGVGDLFAADEEEARPSTYGRPAPASAPAAAPPPPPAREPSAAESARDELAALLASTEARAPDEEAPLAAFPNDPFESAPAGEPEPSAGPAAPATSESWEAIESLFSRRAEPPPAAGGGEQGLTLDWERPEMFTEPTQEEILRRINELSQSMELIERRIDELAKPLGELTEPGTRLAAAFKRLELIERSFEEMRLQSERNTLKTSSALSALDTSMGELRAAVEEPLWEMSERLTSSEIRLTELQAAERLIEQVNSALAKDPFDLISTRDIDEITDGITTKVKRLGSRVERLEAALDRGLSGLEEARRAALSAAKELNKAVEKATARPAKAAAKKPAARKAAAKRATRKPRS
jgi:hypothetical protein